MLEPPDALIGGVGLWFFGKLPDGKRVLLRMTHLCERFFYVVSASQPAAKAPGRSNLRSSG